MKWLAIFPAMLVAAASLWAAEAETPGQRTEARKERSLALDVSLIEWNNAKSDGGWTRWSPRPEVAPSFVVDRQASSRGVPGLRLVAGGKADVFGGWKYSAASIEPGRGYRFTALAETKGVASIRRNIILQVRWTGRDLGVEITPEYVNNFRQGQGYTVTFDETFTAPEGAEGAEISLLIQWAPSADVTFKNIRFETARAAPPRMVRVATIYWRPEERSTAEKNVEAFAALIDKAAAKYPDVVLLPEAVTMVGTGLSVDQAAQDVPGPAFTAFAAKAKAHHCYVIYGCYEKEKGVLYNAAFIVSRDGELVGKYRKVQLPYNEAESGIAPGEFFKTFQLDFGKIGILICYDTAFDEPARVEALDGAEIIFVPIWGGDLVQLKARAMDNGIWLVTSGYDVASAVIDPTGEVNAMTWKEIGDGVAFYALDLTKKFRRPYIGDWRNAVFKHRRTDAYQKIVED